MVKIVLNKNIGISRYIASISWSIKRYFFKPILHIWKKMLISSCTETGTKQTNNLNFAFHYQSEEAAKYL